MSRSVGISVRPKERGRPSHEVLAGFAPSNRVQESQYQHACRRDVCSASKAAPADSLSKTTIPSQSSPRTTITSHLTPNQEAHHFLNISHQFRLFPLHYYQLTKTFSMQTRQWSSTRNTELQAKAQPSHIIQHSKRAQQIEATETEKATPQQETCKHRAKKSKHKQVSQKKFLLSAVTPIGHAMQLQTKRINSPHRSRSLS